MSTHSSSSGSHGQRFNIPHLLEAGDSLAHVVVATLLLFLALGILVASTVSFVNEILVSGFKEFGSHALEYLSGLLFGVILLELLSTILTYIQARKLEATIKDFLIVGLISSIRKILLVGAQSSLERTPSSEFVQEAIGTMLSVLCILLLIGGLMLLDRRAKNLMAMNENPMAHRNQIPTE